MLLMNHRQIKSIPEWLIALTKMSPHVSNSRKTHKLRGKLWQNTRTENSCSTSILIHPLSVSYQIQLVGLKSTRVLLKLQLIHSNNTPISTLSSILVSLSSISTKNRRRWWNRNQRSSGAQRTGDLTGEDTP
jgi:hypothetical protein